MAAYTAGRYSSYQSPPDGRGTCGLKVVALMLGIAVPIRPRASLALWAAVSAQQARDDVQAATAGAPATAWPG